jgi:hypothetical protein
MSEQSQLRSRYEERTENGVRNLLGSKAIALTNSSLNLSTVRLKLLIRAHNEIKGVIR